MAAHRTRLRIFTVVDVWRGIPVGAKNLTRLREARSWVERSRERRNPLEDDVQLFVTALSLPPWKVHTARGSLRDFRKRVERKAV